MLILWKHISRKISLQLIILSEAVTLFLLLYFRHYTMSIVIAFLGGWVIFSYFKLNQERMLHQGHIRAMRILLQQNPPLSQTVDYSRDAIIVLDSQNQILDVSPQVPKIFGIDETVMIGKVINNYLQIPPINSIDSDNPKGEISLKTDHGQVIHLEYRIRPLLDQGSHSGHLLFLSDISEEKRRYEAYLQASKFSVIGQVAAGLAHELRNPLTTIKGFLQLIGPEQFPPSFRPYHKLILDEVETSNELLKNFLLLTNPTAPHFRTLNPEDLVHSAVQILQPTSLMHEVSLHVALNCPLKSILGDEEQLLQALLAVIQNAIDASATNGQIQIKLKVHKDFLQIEVVDFGPGVPENIRKQIFDPFFTTRNERTGLGLTIAQRILFAHHGELLLSPCDQHIGTVVRMRIPTI